MNYKRHYDTLIARAVGRELNTYTERHHIVPRCMGGPNTKDNLVDLTGREHFLAHQLLVKIHPHVGYLVFALRRMSKQCNNGRVYEWHKRRLANIMIGNTFRLGLKQTPYMREALRKSHIGRKNSQTTIAKMRAAALGNKRAQGKKLPPRTPEHCAAISAAKIGRKINRKLTPEELAHLHACRRQALADRSKRLSR